jgi:hypothetical protein
VATGQTILDTMEMLDQELQLQTGEADVTRGLIAINRAQDLLESVIATRPGKFSTIGTVATAASTESTAFPTGVLRIDKLQYIDPTTSRPGWDLTNLNEEGSHIETGQWPFNIISLTRTGKPAAYWTDGTKIYWAPLPDGTHTVRWYGFLVASDVSAAGTFAYDDILILPIASVAVRLMQMGVGDQTNDLTLLAQQAFGPTIDSMSRFNRDGGKPFRYRFHHTT